MEKDASDPVKKSRRNLFFLIAYFLLLAMALCWSVDNSIVIILFGGAAYFIFLGFYTSAEQNKIGNTQGERVWSHYSTDILKGIKEFFSKAELGRPNSDKSPGQVNIPRSKRYLVPLVMMTFFAAFFMLLAGIIFGSYENGSSSIDYFEVAESYYWQGEYDSASINYRRAWRMDENNAQAMVGYGNVLAIRKQYDSAKLVFDKAISVNPEHLAAYYAKGSMCYNMNNYEECIAILNPLLQRNTDYYDGMLLIGDCYYALRKFDDAIVWYSNAYENGGARSSALCHIMAYIYDTKGEYNKAINLYQEALQYDSTIVDIYKRLGELLTNEDGNYYRSKAVKLGEMQ